MSRTRTGCAWLAAFAAALLCIEGPTSLQAREPAIFGLVVGIDDYIGERNDLEGAVHDAEDIAKALKTAGAVQIRKFLNHEATKANIENAYHELLGVAQDGDTIFFSFAGHGSQEPEPPGRHDEADGKNENFLLAGYATQGKGTRERIIDDEIAEWLQKADKKNVRVVFAADSCHSGTMNRSARAETVRFRNGKFGEITDDLLKFPPPEAGKLKEDDFQNITFVGATSEDQLTPEVTIDGQKRGALSWALARALEGRADRDGDGVVTQVELLGFVVPAVHAQVESQQTPQVAPLRARSFGLFNVRSAKPEKPDNTSEPLRIAIDGGTAGPLGDVPFVEVVADKSKADLIWYAASGTIEHKVGGVVALGVNAGNVVPVATKWAALKLLKHRAASDAVDVSLPSGNKRYNIGETVDVKIAGAAYPHLTMFNMPPDGRVEFFIPDPKRKGEAEKDWRGGAFVESFKVANPPYGAEHLVAIFSKTILSDLHAVLAAMKTAKDTGPLRTVLEAVLASGDVQVGVLDIYTGSGG
ncbi:MAG: caspase family protein [Pseudomonadota bacterium]|nr:caspase family protein [Pseudomonadota bacterium]